MLSAGGPIESVPMMVSICQSDLQLTLRLRIAGGQGAEASFR
jgi:hypothetical protein